MDNVLQIEIALNMLNTLFAKAVAFKDDKTFYELYKIRNKIYYGDFNYDSTIESLKKIKNFLNKYD